MLTHEVLCHDCAVDHMVSMGSRPRRCPRCRDLHRKQVWGDVRYLGRQALLGVVSGTAVVGLVAVTVGALTSLVGCM